MITTVEVVTAERPSLPSLLPSVFTNLFDVALEHSTLLLALAPSGTAVGGLRVNSQSTDQRDAPGSRLSISNVFVDFRYRRRGIGSLLMKAAEDWIRQHVPLPQLVGLMVLADNQSAIRLYHRHGYTPIALSDRPITFGSGGAAHLIMYRHIS